MNSETDAMAVNPREQPGGQARKKEPRGDEDRSIANEFQKRNGYPRPDLRDSQQNHQPEFIEKQPNRKEEEEES